MIISKELLEERTKAFNKCENRQEALYEHNVFFDNLKKECSHLFEEFDKKRDTNYKAYQNWLKNNIHSLDKETLIDFVLEGNLLKDHCVVEEREK